MKRNDFEILMLLDWAELVLSCPYLDVHEPDDWYLALTIVTADRAPA